MDAPEKRRRPRTQMDSPMPTDSFDVTCVIGTVELGPDGEHAPHVAAHMLIAKHDAEGVYSFPMADQRTCRVTVEYVGESWMERADRTDSAV